MTSRAQPDIIRRESKTFRLAHCLLPAWRDGEIDSTSAPGSIGMLSQARRLPLCA
ncbi:hypothetical protein [Mesorhizobium sp.]|uniref:hypothetical protein n=1 Tax=Mesorhizobium sp. TaxID=1871066 RepID=UPI00257A53E7|nr:hypothetical protein [Mesorhizobium sp.]